MSILPKGAQLKDEPCDVVLSAFVSLYEGLKVKFPAAPWPFRSFYADLVGRW